MRTRDPSVPSMVRVTLRILLLDDHRMLVEALAARLADAPDVVVDTRGPAGAATVVAYAVRTRPDVVVLEVVPFDDDRRELLLALRRRLPDTPLVVLTADEDPDAAAEVAWLGADGWVSKADGVAELDAMIRAAARGRAWYPPVQLAAVLARLRADARPVRRTGPLEALTDREREILTAMADGASTVALARRLRLSANTVRNHTASIYQKLGVHSRLEAVAAARAAGTAPSADHRVAAR
jgi:two-component system, NarL family, response regulator LiaR